MTKLPRDVYVLQAGLVLNALGNGAANPFLLLYLHDVRGIPLPVAGLATATGAACSVVAALAAGVVADRRGAAPTMVAGLLCSAVAFGLYPLIRLPWHAFAVAALAWTGSGVWLTMQSAVLARIAPPHLRHAAFAQQRVAANIGLGLGGFLGGLIVTTAKPETFTALFLFNAVTFLVYPAFLLRLKVPRPTSPSKSPSPSSSSSPTAHAGQGYRAVLANRAYVQLGLVNLIVIVGAVALLNGVFTVYARNYVSVDEGVIGALFLLNSATIIVCQLPVARAVEGRARSRALALMAVLFGGCWLQVAASGTVSTRTFVVPLLVTAIITMSFAECIYDAVVAPLTADLAPPELLGRYMAVNGFIWQGGFIIGPALGASLLASTGGAVWYLMAAMCGAAAGLALLLGRRLPLPVRLTPRRAVSAEIGP